MPHVSSKKPRHVAPFEILYTVPELQDGVGQIEVEETNLLGRGAGGVVCRASHKPTGHPEFFGVDHRRGKLGKSMVVGWTFSACLESHDLGLTTKI